MKRFLDRFILYFPTLFIKQYPYAWIAAIVLWTWPLNISAVFFLIVAVGIFSLRWREAAWISELRRQYAPKQETFYVDRLPVPVKYAVGRIAILLASGALAAWIVAGPFDLGYWQALIMIVGFLLMYVDTRFFGAATIYIITGGGIAIYYIPGHTDYRIFLRFNEMGQIARVNDLEKIPDAWTICSRLRKVKNGILLVPRYAHGFTKRLADEVLLTPTDVDEFLKYVPSTLVTEKP